MKDILKRNWLFFLPMCGNEKYDGSFGATALMCTLHQQFYLCCFIPSGKCHTIWYL